MKSVTNYLVSCLAVTMVVSGCSRGNKRQEATVIPAKAAASAFNEAAALCAAEGGKLWSKSLCGPMMFADPQSRQAVLNGPSPGSVKDGPIYRLDLPAEEGIANTSKEINGQRWTMIMWPLPEHKAERAILMMHESFHRIQPELGLQGSGGLGTNTHLDARDGRIWMRAEFHALAEALKAEGDARKAALSDAILFEQYRRGLWPEAAAQEQGLELNEGLAESTGIDAAIQDPAIRVKAALADLANCEAAPSFVRSFAYGTGPGYAELLNAADPEWRRSVTKDFVFGAAAAKAYDIKPQEASKTTADAALARYGGKEITAQEEARQKELGERNARFTKLFIEGPVVLFPLERMSITYNPRSVASFEGHGTVYGTLKISDLWGTLEVDGGAALISKDFKVVAVPAASETSNGKPAGEGWNVKLAEGYVLAPYPPKPGSMMAAKK